MQLKDDSRAMSNPRPSLIWQGEVLTLNPPPSTEVVGKHARVQYITWEVEHGFFDLDLVPGRRSRSEIQTNMTPQGESKEEMVSTESQLQVLGIYWGILGPITTSGK
ncbi:hypothetical protein HAV15_003297 [Penicillium sp. str. |nr:hypothetical protein HAV15_003297 [Penicillium sp. str. \